MNTPAWTLKIENFGRIKSAEITLKPLVLMVGRNNTGKSYIASLLWGLLNPYRSLFPASAPEGPCYNNVKILIDKLRRSKEPVIRDSEWSIILNWINELLEVRSREICSSVLACADAVFSRATLSFDKLPPELEVLFLTSTPGINPYPRKRIQVRQRHRNKKLSIMVPEENSDKEQVEYLICKILTASLLSGLGRGPSLYIPAARTGLMLAFRTLMAGLIRSFDVEEGSARVVLPRPIVDFLEEVNFAVETRAVPSIEENRIAIFRSIANDLEGKVLQGSFQVSDGDSNEFVYTPFGTELKLPIHAASSLVTELAPFILILKSGLIHRTIIFEEPEAHLHLSAQRELARALIRLVSAGIQIIITTHSDTFLQQINMLMHLFHHKNQMKAMNALGYENDEILDPGIATGYLFNWAPTGTMVTSMEKTREGFVEPLMNEAIEKITEEFLYLQDTDNDTANANGEHNV